MNGWKWPDYKQINTLNACVYYWPGQNEDCLSLYKCIGMFILLHFGTMACDCFAVDGRGKPTQTQTHTHKVNSGNYCIMKRKKKKWKWTTNIKISKYRNVCAHRKRTRTTVQREPNQNEIDKTREPKRERKKN